jgi:hypothetical protein
MLVRVRPWPGICFVRYLTVTTWVYTLNTYAGSEGAK